MERYKWFWMTFLAWFFLGTLGASAMIFSPFHLDLKEISTFKAKVNGVTDENRILVNSGGIEQNLDALSDQWRKEGWKSVSGNLNLANILLKTPHEYTGALASLVQLRTFENRDSFRLLGLMQDHQNGRTYQWVSEVPKTAIFPPGQNDINFPLMPPSTAMDLIHVETGKLELLTWTQPAEGAAEEGFVHLYASQGFSGRLWSMDPDGSTYLLQMGSTKLLAVIQGGDEEDTISVVKLSKIERNSL